MINVAPIPLVQSQFKWPNMAQAKAFAPALPLYIAWLSMASIGMIDLFLADSVGPEAQAALGIADQVLLIMMLAMTGISAGINTVISQTLGAGNYADARQYKQAGLFVTIAFGIVSTVLGFVFAHPLAQLLCGTNAHTAERAAEYIQICSLANLPWALVQYQGAIFRAAKVEKIVAYQWVLITFAAIVPGTVLFFLWVGAKSLVPLALAWVAASILGCHFGAGLVNNIIPNDNTKPLTLTTLICRGTEVLAIGFPVVISELSWLMSNVLIYSLLTKLPNSVVAQTAWTIHLKVEEIVSYTPLLASGMATATLVGHKVGAGQWVAARNEAKSLSALSTWAMLAAGSLTAVLAPLIVPSMTSNPEARSLSQSLLVGSALTFPLTAVSSIFAAACEGAGRTRLPMAVYCIGFLIIRLPLAWLLATSFNTGVAGVWVAKCISAAFAALSMRIVFNRNLQEPHDSQRPERKLNRLGLMHLSPSTGER